MTLFYIPSMRKNLVYGGLWLALWMTCAIPLQARGIIGHHQSVRTKANGATRQPSRAIVPDVAWNQSADTLELGTYQPPLPKDMGPLPGDNLGTAIADGLDSTTEAYQIIGIKRVVSYLTDANGKLDPSVFTSGIISQHARLRIFVRIIDTEPNDQGKTITIVFDRLNGNSIIDQIGNTLSCQYTLGGALYIEVSPRIIPSNWLNYGKAQVDPNYTSALQIIAEPSQYSPIVGNNKLEYSVYSDDMKSSFIIYVYSFLEFDAAAPILMVHGTAADHTTWNYPNGKLITTNNTYKYGPIYPFVSIGDTMGYFNTVDTGTDISAYKGVWYYDIDLGATSGGNAGIEDSAMGDRGLAVQIPAILDALGAKSCHLIAHSKGGSDCRYFISRAFERGLLKAADQHFTRDDFISKYKILSLYTFGTPNKGTPVADIACAIEPYVFRIALLIQSPDRDVQIAEALSATLSDATSIPEGLHFPHGDAQKDQQTHTLGPLEYLNGLDARNNINLALNNHLYSLLGDADLDSNSYINGDEDKGLFPTNAISNHVWNVVGKVGSVQAAVTNKLFGTVVYIDLTPTYKSYSPEPNDLVTPIWSGIAPDAKVLQAPSISLFLPVSGFSPSLFQGGFGTLYYVSLLSPGNHSLMKSREAAQMLVQQIFVDYPIMNPK